MGLIGFGKAANEVAKRLSAFGMKIVFYDPYIEESKNEATKVDLDHLMQTSDVISIHVNKTKETENLIDDVIVAEDAGDAQFELFLDTSGSKKVSFSGIVTSADMGAAVGDLEVITVNFTANGAVTLAT